MKKTKQAEALKDKRCIPCEGGAASLLKKQEIETFLLEVEGWVLAKNNKSIGKDFTFKNFDKAMDFVNAVADTAELEGHHPDIHIWYNKVGLELSTHMLGGLSENDFILAAKIDAIRF
jgi:4a-hydroxytetrahydrobiopterin dehydratase